MAGGVRHMSTSNTSPLLPPLPKGRQMLSELQSGAETVFSLDELQTYARAAVEAEVRSLRSQAQAEHVGETNFEIWYSENPQTPYTKDSVRRAYWAGYLERAAPPLSQPIASDVVAAPDRQLDVWDGFDGEVDPRDPVPDVSWRQSPVEADTQRSIAAAPDLQSENDTIAELNHAQWLALENVRLLAARHRKEEWAQSMLRFVDEAGTNKAQIYRRLDAASPSDTSQGVSEALPPHQRRAEVIVDAQGVQFGPYCWMSHEKITGYSAEKLNAGPSGLIAKKYVEWLRAALRREQS